MNNYYVYVCKVEGQIRYNGKVRGDRYKHCTSGKSHSKQLNKEFFSNKEMVVDIIKESLSEEDALLLEAELISKVPFEQLFNESRGNYKKSHLKLTLTDMRQPHHYADRIAISAILDSRLEYFDRCLLIYMSYRFDYFKDVLNIPYMEDIQALADALSVHRNTVSRAVQTLKDLGYVTVKFKKGGTNTYTNVTTWLNTN